MKIIYSEKHSTMLTKQTLDKPEFIK